MRKNLYIAKSKINGNGVFSKETILPGQIIFIAKGKLINFKVKNHNDSLVGPNWLGVEENVWLEPLKNDFLEYLNHSCSPNAGIKGKFTFVALRRIKKNEEITFDYSTAEGDKFWKLSTKCKCKSKKCRGTIKSVHHLPKETFLKYQNFIPKYFKRLYNLRNSINDQEH